MRALQFLPWRVSRWLLAAVCAGGFGPALAERESDREQMLADIERHATQAAFETGIDRIEPRVVQALRRVPRHRFVPADQQAAAYDDRPLPIGHGQTISQPYIVALM